MADNFLLNSLFDEREERRPLSVSELTWQVKGELERQFASVWVEGEIVNFTAASSGHWYFNLNDGAAQIRGVCFRTSNLRIKFKPFDGVQVRVRGRLTVYEKRGEYQLIVESLEPAGAGALMAAFEQIKAKLDREGLFAAERKRTLPLLPRRIGVVTSPTGAAIYDIINVLTRRTENVSLVLIPTRVQGESAGEEIAAAIELANAFSSGASEENKIDVLIVGRGGGSAEDLWAFNEERVARAIYGSKIPVISAVGHEVDVTIADMVADLRAPTPSAAAEIVAARESDIAYFIAERRRTLSKLISWKLLEARNELQELSMSPVFVHFPQDLKDLRLSIDALNRDAARSLRDQLVASGNKLSTLTQRLSPVRLAAGVSENRSRLSRLAQKNITALEKRIDAAQEKLKVGMASLDALSPLSVLGRGYSITYKNSGEIVCESTSVAPGDDVKIQLSHGVLRAKVKKIE